MAEQEIIRTEVTAKGTQESQMAEAAIMPELKVPKTAEEVIPLNCRAALSKLPEKERQEVLNLANSIDVRAVEKVLSYGSVPLRNTFNQCGAFLKDERGSQADQKVIAQVIELSKKASASYEDFNLELQEPGFFQKLFLSITSRGKNPRVDKVKNSAVTSYKLLAELQASCASWLDMLKKAYGEIEGAAMSDAETIGLLEKYIIAGQIAAERIEGEITAAKNEYEETGLQSCVHDYDELKEGYNLFQITMANLEKSRIMYHLSIGQLSLIKRSNRNVQVSIHTQVDNSMALIGQQLRNAVLDAKTREVLEGQKAIARLNDELIKEVSKTVGLTAEETERLIYAGFYNLEAAKEAVTTVINSCQAIERTASEMLPKMKADMSQIEGLIEQLQPHIGSVETLKIEGSTTPSGGTGELTF